MKEYDKGKCHGGQVPKWLYSSVPVMRKRLWCNIIVPAYRSGSLRANVLGKGWKFSQRNGAKFKT